MWGIEMNDADHIAFTYPGVSSRAKIFPFCKIIAKQDAIWIGNHSQLDDFVFIYAGIKCNIGRYVHVASFSSITGGGTVELADFSGMSAGCRIISGSDDFTGGSLTNPTVPAEFTNVTRGSINIGRHAILGANVIVLPNVEIGEGAAIGAGAVIRESLEPWGIYVDMGGRIRKIGERDKESILKKEAELLNKLGS